MKISDIKTVIILMFENRSFDHMLGHLSLENPASKVDGLREPLKQYENTYKGTSYPAYNVFEDNSLPFDLPHELNDVAVQLAQSPITGNYTMKGFVEAYAASTKKAPNKYTEPMSYFSSSQVPITSFLAKEFCVCDRWHCSLPTGTQPNRTMAFSGDTQRSENGTLLSISDDNIFSWLTRNNVSWRTYHDGLSFFVLYKELVLKTLSPTKFKDYEFLFSDLQNEPVSESPEVIIVEPSYQSAPHIGMDRPNDNHAPLAIGWGEEFLRRTYEAAITNPKKWKNTVLIVYYDEHGGFYDHVKPPKIGYKTTGNPSYQFNSLGPRIPGVIVSPFVKQNSISNLLFDHTSVLQFLAERFTPGKPYNQTVEDRRKSGIMSISAVLNNDTPWTPPLPPNVTLPANTVIGRSIASPPTEMIAQSFELAAIRLMKDYPDKVQKKYPDLLQWKKAIENARA